MKSQKPKSRFTAKVQTPIKDADDHTWSFIVIPKTVSDTLPRRGRTTIEGTINGHDFQATLDPDGQLGHWLKIDEALKEEADLQVGIDITLEVSPVAKEPNPEIPCDLKAALDQSAKGRKTWEETTNLARLDWIHWVVSAKHAKTRAKRIADACDMLSNGKRRVCCFDPSGYYSKAFRLPESLD